jgi:hypothetical protein
LAVQQQDPIAAIHNRVDIRGRPGDCGGNEFRRGDSEIGGKGAVKDDVGRDGAA